MKQKDRKTQKTDKAKRQAASYIKYTGIAFEMLATIGAGALLGWYLDQKRGPESVLYIVIFSLLGMAIALYRVYKMVTS